IKPPQKEIIILQLVFPIPFNPEKPRCSGVGRLAEGRSGQKTIFYKVVIISSLVKYFTDSSLSLV
ncbi:MAG: hypothetical protein ABIQ93_17770, partial [Saprospiraceae bacterium]